MALMAILFFDGKTTTTTFKKIKIAILIDFAASSSTLSRGQVNAEKFAFALSNLPISAQCDAFIGSRFLFTQFQQERLNFFSLQTEKCFEWILKFFFCRLRSGARFNQS